MTRRPEVGPSAPSDLYALLKRRGYLWPSFDIYGGIAGFYDLGPLGSILRENMEGVWKSIFLLEEGFQLVDCPSITPEVVFRHSGHLDKFTDQITRCERCDRSYRADHLAENGEAGTPIPPEEIARSIAEGRITCPLCGGPLSEPEEFNLMFSTEIGPGKGNRGFLRPETAQNIFINFSLLYRLARNRMPFGVAQIGKGFRNEISPRQGLIRLREFHMAEGEFFFDPTEADFPPFTRYRDRVVRLVPGSSPDTTLEMSLGEAIERGVIDSEVLAHFLGVTQSFSERIGIDRARTRFRQHRPSEMAHYARDCWDLEVETSYGWIEMVGIADRSAYDLTQHSKGSNTELYAVRKLAEPRKVQGRRIVPDPKVLGPLFRGRAKEVAETLSVTDPSVADSAISAGSDHVTLEVTDGPVDVPLSAFRMETFSETVHQERYVPNVVEPSFGIDRLMLAVLEHSYSEDPERSGDGAGGSGQYMVLRLPSDIAPIKCGVFPLLNKEEMVNASMDLDARLRVAGIATYHDASDSIGRRYARMDEVGTPFCVTIDHDSLSDGTATIRDRDGGAQVRVPISGIPDLISDLTNGRRSFKDL